MCGGGGEGTLGLGISQGLGVGRGWEVLGQRRPLLPAPSVQRWLATRPLDTRRVQQCPLPSPRGPLDRGSASEVLGGHYLTSRVPSVPSPLLPFPALSSKAIKSP